MSGTGLSVACNAYITGTVTLNTAVSWIASAGSPSSKTATGGGNLGFTTTLSAPGSTTITVQACNGSACLSKPQTVRVH